MTKSEYTKKFGFPPLPIKIVRARKYAGFQRAAGHVFTSRGANDSFVYTCPFCGKSCQKRGSGAGFVKASYQRHSYQCELVALENYYQERGKTL